MQSEIDTQESPGSLHCCACDSSFHPPYYEEEGRFEELCPTCLTISLGYRPEDEVDELINLLLDGGLRVINYDDLCKD